MYSIADRHLCMLRVCISNPVQHNINIKLIGKKIIDSEYLKYTYAYPHTFEKHSCFG